MTIVVLHLSDIHIKNQSNPILRRGPDIAASLFSVLPSASHVFILVSGDVAFSGSTDQYVLASQLLEEIQRRVREETSCPVDFVIAPGNHDCNFQRDSGARRAVVSALESEECPEVDDSIIRTCTEIQEEFFDFRNRLEARDPDYDDRLWRTSRFQAQGKVIDFDCLNVSWVSRLSEEPGRLFFPVDRYQAKVNEEPEIRIVILHHPLNWFNQSIYRKFRTFVRKIATLLVSGHEHQGTVGTVLDAEAEPSAFVEGCVLEGHADLTDSGFNVIQIDLEHKQFSSIQFRWSGKRFEPTEDGSWSDYHELPAKRASAFGISEAFHQSMDDPGAFFKHPGVSNISLPDIFIYPDVRKVGNGEDRRRVFISSSQLLSPEATLEGVIVEGEEKAGRTSLLYQLFREYHDRGFVPLLLRGKELVRSADAAVDNAVRLAFEAQYSAEQFTAFEQLPRERKLLLLDDFDEGPMKSAEARAGLLCLLRKRFGHIVVTVSEMFEVREMLEGDRENALASLEHYRLQPFGHALRGQLIWRWLSLGADGTVDDGTLLARRDQAENLMNSVMTKAVVPAVPIYLLTLLQSMDAGRGGDFKDSGLGYYYQYLLTEAFLSSGVRAEKLTEVFQYAAQLAWEFQVQDKRELSESELREFNRRFSQEWHTVDFASRLEVLMKARVLRRVGDEYEFHYPYVYYYLKGQALSEKLADLEVRAYIGHCCNHLYVRDHANTMLFLAHFSNDEFVLNSIADGMHSLFKSCRPIAFRGDTDAVSRLISDAPRLQYTGDDPHEYRNRKNELADRLDDGHDGLTESEEDSDELSLIAQMTMLFKTAEILGQVLKNQYSKIQRVRKVELLEELFDGPLRALRDFFDYCEKSPDALVAVIESAVQKKGKVTNEEERKAIARKAVGGVVQLISYGFVARAAQSANSESLREEVETVVKRRDSPAFKLIELSILLDSPKAIPRAKLKRLHKEVKADLVGSRLLQLIVLNRLYMFKASEKDMQWLHGELKIDLDLQHAIAYQEKRTKRITT